jgi:hypothetical protein
MLPIIGKHYTGDVDPTVVMRTEDEGIKSYWNLGQIEYDGATYVLLGEKPPSLLLPRGAFKPKSFIIKANTESDFEIIDSDSELAMVLLQEFYKAGYIKDPKVAEAEDKAEEDFNKFTDEINANDKKSEVKIAQISAKLNTKRGNK